MLRPNECDNFTDAELVALLAEDTGYLRCVSQRTRAYCIRFMQHIYRDADTGMLEDVYHDALIVLYEKAKGGAFSLNCALQTYLNSVCRNMLLARAREDARIASFMDVAPNDDYLDAIKDQLHPDALDINNERVQAIMKGLELMKNKGDCYELLQLVHYQGKAMKEVAAYFGYKNEQIARNKNYLCREKLKALAFKLLKKHE